MRFCPQGLSQAAHGPLIAAESLYARTAPQVVVAARLSTKQTWTVLRLKRPNHLGLRRNYQRIVAPWRSTKQVWTALQHNRPNYLGLRRDSQIDAAGRAGLWATLESARRGLAVVQHHDAITGTPCSGREGCTGVDQVLLHCLWLPLLDLSLPLLDLSLPFLISRCLCLNSPCLS